MKLHLTLTRPDGSAADVAVTADAGATVGELADALLARDPARPKGAWAALDADATLVLVGRAGAAPIERGLPLPASGLRNGAVVTLAPSPRHTPGARDALPAATVRVLEGPDRGLAVRVPRGTLTIGRAPSTDVRLTDPQVSREHARLVVADAIEIIDLGSANGLVVRDGTVTRCTLRPGDTVQLGDTVVRVDPVEAHGATTDSLVVPFNRAPRVEIDYPGRRFTAPQPPERPQSERFPMLPLLAPLLFGAVLYLLTHTLAAVVFVALSPVLMLANLVESRIGTSRAYKAALKEFRADLADVVARAGVAVEEERQHRDAERPSTAACAAAVGQRSTLLWSRRPGGDAFLSLRLGTGALPARTSVDLPSSVSCPREIRRELEETLAPLATVSDVPVTADLRRCGSIGVSGPRADALSVARALVIQAVALHSPAEVVLVGLASTTSAPDWDWLKWLPHASSPHSPLDVRPLAATAPAGGALVSALEAVIDDRLAEPTLPGAPAMLVVAEDDAPVERARLVELAARGAKAGVHVLWVAPTPALLPAACRTFVDLTAALPAVGQVDDHVTVTPVAPERLGAPDALAIARALAPVVDSGALVDDETDLPRSVSWLALHGTELANESGAVLDRWVAGRSVLTGPYAALPSRHRRGSLRALVGQAAGEPHVLDLRTHGPHALVGGTTGSGKSELLQSWILGMAAAHSPQRVTFLLVDYKGGSAFADCVDLPHTVGLVTDLSPHLVHRALTSLSAELRYRERLLNAKKAKDLLELELRGDPETPPSLVIVVDEFAALAREVPEFVDGVVDVAQRGRSLGLHLVLATQRPAGVINDNLRANTNLRLALRMADEADSIDVLGSAQAAYFDPGLPGRAVSKTGPGRLVPFQAAYAGGWTTDVPLRTEIAIEELTFGAVAEWVAPSVDVPVPAVELGPTDIARVVDTIQQANRAAELAKPRRPWLPELAPVYDLAKLPMQRRDTELVFAVGDDPEHQAQPTVAFCPDRDGNLAVFGTGGTGKSALLRTIAVAAGLTVRGGPCHVYGIDFGSRGLAMLEKLPHVGSVITGGDHERINRLIGQLRATVDERAARYARVNAGTISDYRGLADAPDEPRIIVLVDGMGAFRSAYEFGEEAGWFEAFLAVAADGRPVGVHVVLSSDRAAAVPSTLGSAVQRRVVLRLADDAEYGLMGLPADVLTATSPPGRGLLDGTEIQVAVLGGARETLAQAQAIDALADAMHRAGASRAPEIRRLPELVELADLPVEVGGRAVIGLSGETLEPVGIDARGTFVITGPAGSGRTSALHAVIAAAHRADPAARCYFFGPSGGDWADIAWAAVARGPADIVTLAGDLATRLAAPDGRAIVVVEALPNLLNSPAELAVEAVVRAAVGAGQFVVTEGDVKQMSGGLPLLEAAKTSRSGIALAPEQFDGTVVFATDFPRVRRGDFPPGRGLLVQKGVVSLIQVGFVRTAAVPMTHSVAAGRNTP